MTRRCTVADQKTKAAKLMHITMRSRRLLCSYPRNEDAKDIFLDLVLTTAVWLSGTSEDEAVKIFRDALRWVRDDSAAEPTPPSTLN